MEKLSKICEMMMLLCFAFGWPVSIIKSLRTKVVKGKSPAFMMIVIVGYLFGIVYKITSGFDWVSYLYIFNITIVSIDLFLYFYYSKKRN
jgi:Na+/glutamate symporter